jgi:hypothetical protein
VTEGRATTSTFISVGLALGAGVGSAFGVVFENVGVGVALGAGVGLLIGSVLASRQRSSD